MNGDPPSAGVFDQFLSRARRFYTPPSVVLRAMEFAGQLPVDISAVSQCIGGDPTLAARIVRLANCSLFRLNPSVDDVQQLIERLGAQPLQLLMLGCSVPTDSTTTLAPELKKLFWHCFLLTAAASGEIASSWYQLPPLESFAGGVTRGLGILALVHELGDSYASFLLEVWNSMEDLSTQEGKVLGFDHGQLGVKLLDRQFLPSSLVEAMTRSQDSDRLASLDPAQRSLSQVLHLADLVARLFANDRFELLDILLRTGQEYCGMTPSQLEALACSLEHKVPELAAALAIDPPDNTDYSRMLLSAQQRCEEMANSSAIELSFQNRADLPLTSGGEEQEASSRGTASGESLMERITGAVARCRQARCPLSLVLTQVDDSDTDSGSRDGDSSVKIIQRLNSAIRQVAKADGKPTRVSDTRFALILEKYDRRHAVELAWKIVDTIRTWSDSAAGEPWPGLTVSVGLATLAMPPRNFPVERIVTAAQRCLSGVQLSGGDGVKSIDII